jgi:hypothetical protein
MGSLMQIRAAQDPSYLLCYRLLPKCQQMLWCGCNCSPKESSSCSDECLRTSAAFSAELPTRALLDQRTMGN